MLTGKLPQGMFEMPSLQVPGLDPRYDKIVATAMRDDRELRYASARALRLELDAILTQPVVKVEASAKEAPPALNTQARPKRPEWQPPKPVNMPPARQMKRSRPYTSILLVSLCVAAGWIYWRQSGYRFVVEPTPPEEHAKGQTSAAIPAASKESPFVNTLGMKFVPVPITGGPTSGQQVLFSVWETRVQDFEAFVKDSGLSWSKSDVDQGPIHAVAGVSWEDAQAFCKWLTKKERASGKISTGETYRLPSDHEWSCAVGIGEQEDASKLPIEKSNKVAGRFPWGSQWPPPLKWGNFWSEELRPLLAEGKHTYTSKQESPGYVDGQATTGPVGGYPANGLGLYDLWGNLWEWCDDWYDATKRKCVLRGMSWREAASSPLVSSARGTCPPSARVNRHGFRCVLSTASAQELSSIANSGAVRPDASADGSAIAKSAAKAAPATNATSADTVLLPRGPTTWTDVKGRSLVATFKSIQGNDVLLEIAGKTQPVALATLSEGSRNLARAYQSRADPMAASKEPPFINTLGMKFVPVPGTKVLFCIHETQWQDYAAYAAEHAGIDSTWKNQSHDGYALTERKEEHPVTQVGWEDAQAFCTWLSKKEGKIYRLPTDSEWSIAIGIGHLENWAADTTPGTVFKDQKEFPWGPIWPPTNGSGNYSDESRKAKAPSGKASYLEGYEDLFPTTAPVMSFRPNKLGIHDLDGNVREWVQEWYDDSKKYRGLRGGSWVASDREGLLSSSRTRVRPEARYNDVGFRVVLANDADQLSAAKTAGPSQAAPTPGSSATSKSSGGATLTSQGQMTRALTSGAAPPPAPLLSSTGISSAVDAIKQSGTDKKTCLKRFLALSEQTKGVYSYKLQNEIRHYAVDLDRTAELAACNEIFANERMHPYIISILDGTLAPGQKNAPAKDPTQVKQVALEARTFPFVRAACWLRAGELLSGLGRFDEAAASYKHVLEMPDEKLSAYKELARIRLEKLPK
jgi:formylglycine-generating enzyme required for sulfatase activity